MSDNRLNVMRKVIDVVEYIEDNQNSPEFDTYKRILLKVVSSISSAMSVGVVEAPQPEAVQDNTPQITSGFEPDYKGELPDNFDESTCQVFKNNSSECGDSCDDCECLPNQSDDIHDRFMSDKEYLPKIDIQETIEKIRKEIGNGTKN